MKDMERRVFPVAEFRMGEDDPTIEGYAAVFNSMSEDLGGFREIVAPGAFKGSIDGDVRAFWNHDANFVLGRTRAGTLILEEDEKGLKVRIKPPASAAHFLESMRRGDVDQMSFGFRVLDDDWTMRDGTPLRTLRAVELFEVSPVAIPAYPATEVAVRARDAFLSENEQAPDFTLVRARLRLASV